MVGLYGEGGREEVRRVGVHSTWGRSQLPGRCGEEGVGGWVASMGVGEGGGSVLGGCGGAGRGVDGAEVGKNYIGRLQP